MPRHSFTAYSQNFRCRDGFLNHRHVAVLAALFFAKVALQPLLIRHLLRKLADLLSSGSQRRGDQRVAGRAQFRLPDVIALGRTVSARRRSHDAVLPVFDFKRPIFFALAQVADCIHDESANQAFARSQLLFGDLVAKRARDAVLSHPVQTVIRAKRKMRENLAFVSIEFGLIASHRHVAFRALIFDHGLGLGMIDRLAAHARLPVRIPRRVCHHCGSPGKSDRDVLAGRRRKPVVACETAIRCLKQFFLDLVILFRKEDGCCCERRTEP